MHGKISVKFSAQSINDTCSPSIFAVSEAHRDIAKKVPASNTLYSPSKAEQLLRYDNKKSIEVLGMKYRGIDQLTKDIVDDFKFRGWL